MSVWAEVLDEQIDLDPETEEVHISVGQDYFGSNYLTLTYDQIRKLYKEIEESSIDAEFETVGR